MYELGVVYRNITRTDAQVADRLAALAGLAPIGLQPKRRAAFLFSAPADAEITSHRLMMRAGFIKRLAAGLSLAALSTSAFAATTTFTSVSAGGAGWMCAEPMTMMNSRQIAADAAADPLLGGVSVNPLWARASTSPVAGLIVSKLFGAAATLLLMIHAHGSIPARRKSL